MNQTEFVRSHVLDAAIRHGAQIFAVDVTAENDPVNGGKRYLVRIQPSGRPDVRIVIGQDMLPSVDAGHPQYAEQSFAFEMWMDRAVREALSGS